MQVRSKKLAAKMTRTSTELPRLEPESSASANSAMAAERASISKNPILGQMIRKFLIFYLLLLSTETALTGYS